MGKGSWEVVQLCIRIFYLLREIHIVLGDDFLLFTLIVFGLGLFGSFF